MQDHQEDHQLKHKFTLAAAALAAFGLTQAVTARTAEAANCGSGGPVTIAEMTWL